MIDRARAWIPHGVMVSDEEWQRRHRTLLVLLAVQIPALFAFGLWRGFGVDHLLLELAVPVAAVAAGSVYLYQSFYADGQRPGLVSAKLGAPFNLIDHNGNPIDQTAFEAQPTAIFFGFTHCPEVCPTSLNELALWLEADRMGFLLPAVTQEKLDNQRDVVKNERRQNYEDRPYGREYGAWTAALYPPDHPYSWTTIGSHEDLTAASLEDVHAFFRRWYGPNNAVLTIGGDIDVAKTKAWVNKYFGEIPTGPKVEEPEPQPVTLDETRIFRNSRNSLRSNKKYRTSIKSFYSK